MWALVKENPPWKEDFFFAMKLARQKLSKYHAEVTPVMSMLIIPAHIVDPFCKLQSFRQWKQGVEIHTEDETSYTTPYQDAFLKYVENEYCAKHRSEPVIQA